MSASHAPRRPPWLAIGWPVPEGGSGQLTAALVAPGAGLLITATGYSVAFALIALAPLVAILALPASSRIAVTFVAVIVALVATGWLSAHLGGAPKRPALLRLVIGGALAMAVTFGIGYLFGVATG